MELIQTGTLLAAVVTAGATTAALWQRHRDRPRPLWHLRANWWEMVAADRDPAHSTLPCRLANVGDGAAYNVTVSVEGATFGWARTQKRDWNPLPHIPAGEVAEFVLTLDRDGQKTTVRGVHVNVTWHQPPRRTKRRGPRLWSVEELRPGGAEGPPARA